MVNGRPKTPFLRTGGNRGFVFVAPGKAQSERYGIQSWNKYDWLTTEIHTKGIKDQTLKGVIYLLMDVPETTSRRPRRPLFSHP